MVEDALAIKDAVEDNGGGHGTKVVDGSDDENGEEGEGKSEGC